MIVLWEPMYPGDTRSKIPTRLFADPRVTSFWDPDEISGNWFAAHPLGGLGGGGIVWDAYYAFPAGAKWRRALSAPVAAGSDIIGSTDGLRTSFIPLLR
jgi:hypothetical protein